MVFSLELYFTYKVIPFFVRSHFWYFQKYKKTFNTHRYQLG